jgi:hypothetical protein
MWQIPTKEINNLLATEIDFLRRSAGSLYVGWTKSENQGRSQSRSGLRPSQTLESWVRILLEAWMKAFSVPVLSCVGSGLATG